MIVDDYTSNLQTEDWITIIEIKDFDIFILIWKGHHAARGVCNHFKG